jgi:hypothetical protein
MSTLNLNVLVLNYSYYPVHVTSVRNAFVMLCKGNAEAVTIENGHYQNYDINSWAELSDLKQKLGIVNEDDWVSTARLAYLVPRVIRVLNYKATAEQKVILTRRNIYHRDDYTCQYCGKKFKREQLTWDHIVPRSKGGKNTWLNLVTACKKCNWKKDRQTPSEAGMKLIRPPFKPNFIPNFRMCISNKKYIIWKHFVSELYWNVELSD